MVLEIIRNATDHYALIKTIAQRQDHVAFAELFVHFAPRIKGWMIRSGVEPMIADEIAQETLATVWRTAAFFNPTKITLVGWIFGIARDLRATIVHTEHHFSTGLDVTSSETAEQTVSLMERETRLRLAIKTLPAEQAIIIRKAYFEGKSHSTIERELHIPLGTVKARLRLAIRRLRAQLDDLE